MDRYSTTYLYVLCRVISWNELMKINKDIRNLLMQQSETKMINSRNCIYKGKNYSFLPITNKEIVELCNQLCEFLDYENKSWFYKIFHKEKI